MPVMNETSPTQVQEMGTQLISLSPDISHGVFSRKFESGMQPELETRYCEMQWNIPNCLTSSADACYYSGFKIALAVSKMTTKEADFVLFWG